MPGTPQQPDTPAPQTPPADTGALAPAATEKPTSAIHERQANGQIAPGGSTGGSNDTNKNGTAGAPTKYTDDLPDRLIAYFEQRTKDFYRKEVKSESTGKNDFSKTEWQLIANDLPTMQGFAKTVEVTAKTLHEWSDETLEDGETYRRPDFRAAYMRAQDMQQEMLVANGLTGLYAPKFAVFVAQNFTEMRDKQAVDHTTKGEALPAPMVYLPEDLPDEAFDAPPPAAEPAA